MLGEVTQKIVDTGIAGFAVTDERDDFVSFSPGIFKSTTRAFVRRPHDTDISFIYHVGQFLPQTWFYLSMFYFSCFLIFLMLLVFLSNSCSKSLANSLEVVLRGVISMVSVILFMMTVYVTQSIFIGQHSEEITKFYQTWNFCNLNKLYDNFHTL